MNKTPSAEELLEQAITLEEQGRLEEAISLYHQTITLSPGWGTPHYNLGLIYKYRGNWQRCYEHNQKAVALDPDNEAAWWNLCIAASVMEDWRTARTAWTKFGLELEINDEEPSMDLGRAPVRLNPDDEGEVVWCQRIDPARAIILNVPLASSGHRYGDLVLNDGAPVGTRISNGVEYAVFNELQLLEPSSYHTYSITAYSEKQSDIDKLEELCKDSEVELEDWSTIRYLCRQCSEGVPHKYHDQELEEQKEPIERYLGLAAISREAVEKVLANWKTITLCEHSELLLELEYSDETLQS